jgi:hypothetical protein
MAAKQCADIKPTGLRQRDLVDLFYMIITSIRGIAAKLDADGNVTDTDFLATVDAVMNLVIEDCRGHHLDLAKDETSSLVPTVMIGPLGFDKGRFSDLLYMIHRAWHLLCAKLDADGNPPTSTDYDTDCNVNVIPFVIENSKGTQGGNGTEFYFRMGVFPQKEVVDFLYDLIYGIDLFCQQADTDAAPADSDYESLWYTNNITLTVESSRGDRIGN